MTSFVWLLAILAGVAFILSAVYRKYYKGEGEISDIDDFYRPPEPQNSPQTTVSHPDAPVVIVPAPALIQPVVINTPRYNPPMPLQWDTPSHTCHAFRVLCDQSGLSLENKNLLSACVFQESRFDNKAVCHNAHSSDLGFVQINDKIWTGIGEPFTDGADIVAHPEKAATFLIRMFKAGKLDLWVSYKSGAYHQWLSLDSPMWALVEESKVVG